MASGSALTIELKPELEDQLDRLADTTHRAKSRLVEEAISDYVARELSIIEGIERGLKDAREGRLVPHEEVMAMMDEIIAAAERKQG